MRGVFLCVCVRVSSSLYRKKHTESREKKKSVSFFFLSLSFLFSFRERKRIFFVSLLFLLRFFSSACRSPARATTATPGCSTHRALPCTIASAKRASNTRNQVGILLVSNFQESVGGGVTVFFCVCFRAMLRRSPWPSTRRLECIRCLGDDEECLLTSCGLETFKRIGFLSLETLRMGLLFLSRATVWRRRRRRRNEEKNVLSSFFYLRLRVLLRAFLSFFLLKSSINVIVIHNLSKKRLAARRFKRKKLEMFLIDRERELRLPMRACRSRSTTTKKRNSTQQQRLRPRQNRTTLRPTTNSREGTRRQQWRTTTTRATTSRLTQGVRRPT